MIYTVRYAHLYEPVKLKAGETVTYGDSIGTMGTSGQSKNNHLHIDVIEGHHKKLYKLKEIGEGKKYTPNLKQLNYFNDDDLFKVKPFTTTQYMSLVYKEKFGKDHPALDLVPIDRHSTNKHFKIYWNRTKIGTVLKTGYDAKGYGNYIMVGFDT